MRRKVELVFPQGKLKALTLSYDDGRKADKRLVELFNHYGLKGTFHLNSDKLFSQGDHIPADEIAELFHGHEVSAHTVTHPMVERSPREQLIFEFMEDRKALEEVVRYPIRGLSYPFGSYDDRIRQLLPELGFEYARTTKSNGEFRLPEDWFAWHPTCHHKNALASAERFLHIEKLRRLSVLYVWGHSYEFDNDNNWSLMEQFGELAGRREDIWYATNIDIVDYVKAYQRLQFSAACTFVHNPLAMPVWIAVNGKVLELAPGQHTELDS